jgi:hypothetical protein
MNINKEEALKRMSAIEAEQKELRKIIEECDKPKNIMDVIKTYEDARKSKYVTKEDLWFESVQGQMPKNSLAFEKAKVISKALNEGHVFKMDGSQNRYYPYFSLSSGFVFDITGCAASDAYASSASALCFLSRELALYAGKQFEEVYRDLIIG